MTKFRARERLSSSHLNGEIFDLIILALVGRGGSFLAKHPSIMRE